MGAWEYINDMTLLTGHDIDRKYLSAIRAFHKKGKAVYILIVMVRTDVLVERNQQEQENRITLNLFFWSRIYSSLGISKISITPYTSVRRNTKFSSARSVHMSVLPPSISVECISIHMIELYGICFRVGLTICKKWIRKWLGDELTERHYLSQWPSIITPCGIIGLQWP